MITDWKSLSIAEIEKRFDQTQYAPNVGDVLKWYSNESQRVQEELAGERFQYGRRIIPNAAPTHHCNDMGQPPNRTKQQNP